MTTVFAGAVLVGCGGDSGGSDGSGGQDVPIYEYKGEGLPDMVHTTTNLTVTKDAIYAGKFDASGDSIFRIDL